MKPVLEVRSLGKSFGAFRAVDSVSFEVAAGEFVSLLGPSGCGKTTTLRCIAGLERAGEGQISLDGQIVSARDRFVSPHLRNIGMVFQSYAMWPHMTVEQHLEYGLKIRRIALEERRDRTSRMLSLVGLNRFASRYPSQLSGGQQQRVALARALVLEPKLVLFDEPLSNLDAKLRNEMRDELKELKTSIHMTAVYVTHDQAEALVLSERIIVMSSGKIAQIGTPEEIYRLPRNKFVAEFMGATNIIPVAVKPTGAPGECEIRFPFGPPMRLSGVEPRLIDTARSAAVKAEWIDLLPGSGDSSGCVTDVAITGERVEYLVDINDTRLRVSALRPLPFGAGDRVSVEVIPSGVSLLPESA